MINNIFNSSNNSFVSTLDTYSIDQLVNLYIEYSHAKYFKEHDNMEEILNYISSYILKNLPKLSFLEIGDIYSKIAVKENDIKESIESNKNIINSILFESGHKNILEANAKAKSMDVETYKNKRNQDLKVCEQFEEEWKPIYSLLNTFKMDILSYMNVFICSVSDADKVSLMREINETIESNSVKIKKGAELRQDRKKLEIQSRFMDLNEMKKLYDSMNTTSLEQQNYIYLNFKSVLNSLSKGNSK